MVAPYIAPGSSWIRTWRHVAPASGGFTATWASGSWRWYKGWRSLEADPGDHSGHRFLADTYSVLPRHEVARVSELLQSQLLQPLSATPVPPRLGEADLFFLAGTGPDALAFNEFNPLFTRDGVIAQVSGVAGGTGLFADEATVSGLWKRVAFSAGQFHYQTDGFRANNFQDRNTYNAFVQTQVTGSTSIQAEIRGEDLTLGDVRLLFDPRNFSTGESTRVESTTARVGLRHVFSPRSQVIGSLYWSGSTEDFATTVTAPLSGSFEARDDIRGWVGEFRHFLEAGRWRVTSGFSRFWSQSETQESLQLQLPFPPFEVTQLSNSTVKPQSTTGYVYSTLNLPGAVDLTIGVAAAQVEAGLIEVSKVSPKAGITWRPVPSTLLRAAAFGTLGRRGVAAQTIEPTNVAGFNQFYRDDNGVEATRYGVAIDQAFGSRLVGGLESSWRKLTVPVDFDRLVVLRFPNREALARSYAYWTPSARTSVSVEYLFERLDRTPETSEANVVELRTHRVPLGVRYFDTSGWFAGLSATRIAQRGRFASIQFARQGDDRFWVLDAVVGYRLPRRYGRVTVEVKNATDERFSFQDTDPANPQVRPARVAMLKFVLGT